MYVYEIKGEEYDRILLNEMPKINKSYSYKMIYKKGKKVLFESALVVGIEKIEGRYYISNCASTTEETLIIPATVGGKKISGILQGALYGCKASRILYISVEPFVISTYSFSNLKDTKIIELLTPIERVERLAFFNCQAIVKLGGTV